VDPSSLYCHTSISLSTLLECLNIFGNSGGGGAGGGKWSKGGGRGDREGTSFDEEGEGYGARGRKRQGGGAEEEEAAVPKERTSLRISYKGLGEPLVMLFVLFPFSLFPLLVSSFGVLRTDRLFLLRSLEESGIVTRCELTTYEPDGLLDLAFPDDERIVRLIMKVRFPFSPFLSIASEQLKSTRPPANP
jgi:cell cycle checkpoint protein